ncbi:MAG TPA: recombination mediator RecR [Candidatus Gastranaerophilales bacterium]|nr:recombination mediator RecR [Candidatus Gastranaerophilales bacterium]
MTHYSKPLARLVEELQKLPGIGPKSAQRMAFYILKMPLNEVQKFTDAILEAKEKIKYCRNCFNMSSENPCEICVDDKRNRAIICIVAETKDLIALERTREYKGSYHVLQGLISPLDGITPDDLRIKELFERLKNEDIEEIILALNPSIEGEATSMYLTKLIKPLGVKVSRIAFGLPMGADLEYADELTLARALEGRREV